MAKSMHALFAHGIGEQKSGFSAYAQKRLASGLASKGRVLYGAEALWAPVLDDDEAVMLSAARKRGSSTRMLPRLVVGTLGDALAFPNRLEEIFDVFDLAYCRLRAPGPVTLFAHSLGVKLVLAWLEARPTVQVERLVSFGNNIELWWMGRQREFRAPAQLHRGNWLNMWDEDDMLGWSIGHFAPAVDREVSVGSIFTGSWGLAHNAYWGDRKLWRRTLPGLIA